MHALQLIRSDDDSHESKLRYLLKISALPAAVALTTDSRLIVGSSGGRLVSFNLSQLAPSFYQGIDPMVDPVTAGKGS